MTKQNKNSHFQLVITAKKYFAAKQCLCLHNNSRKEKRTHHQTPPTPEKYLVGKINVMRQYK